MAWARRTFLSRYDRTFLLSFNTPKQWQSLVPKDILQDVAAEYGGDVGDGKLTAPVHFWLLLVGVLSKNCSSLKDLIARTQERFGRVLGWLKGDKPWLTPAAVSQRNGDRPVAFWQNLYQRLRKHHFSSRWLRKAWQKKFVAIEAIDSSTFRLMARLRHVFAPSGSGGPKKGSKNRKGALKIHQVYNVGGELPEELGIGPAKEHDRKGYGRALKQAQQGVLYLLDRGYCCFKLWWEVNAAWSYFITPLKAGMKYEHKRWLNPKRQRDRVRDELVLFPGMDRGKEFVILRVVHILQDDGSWWSYVTNLIDEGLSPSDIADLYSLRWRIETYQPDYTSSATWARPRFLAYHQRNRAARVGDLVPAAARFGSWRHRMSEPSAVPPAPGASQCAGVGPDLDPPACTDPDATPSAARPTPRSSARRPSAEGGRS